MKKLFCLVLILSFFACHEEQTIPVEIDVVVHVPEDRTLPLVVDIENNTKNASSFLWTFEGGDPATSTQKNPGSVIFAAPGEHTITLGAWNDGFRTSKIYTVSVDSAVYANFKADVEINNYAPAAFRITNLSSGGSSYKWTFEGGKPANFEGIHPPVVTYEKEGKYPIVLTIENGSATFSVTQEIEVREALEAFFEIIPSFEDEDDMEAPLRATFKSSLQGVESLMWKCGNADITNEDSGDAEIFFPDAGKYVVMLEVFNGKETKNIAQTITVKENTNLRTHKNIHLGINTAQETIGSFYSTKLRKQFKSSEVDAFAGNRIDIAYFGLNTDFTYNQFVSPDKLSETPLKEIPNASSTFFVNRFNPGQASISVTQFEQMTTDALLKNLAITERDAEKNYFTQSDFPYIILFETWDKRKGAILVKEMVSNGLENSYVIVDIKIQKND